MTKRIIILAIAVAVSISAFAQNVITGAESTHEYLPLLKGKKVAVLTNQTGIIGNTHLVDSLVSLKVNIVAILSPEHGFRGDADAGEHVASSVDEKTGIPIKSLYEGNTGKPAASLMKEIDVMIYDLQDVGLRYYTYLTTMARMMEACAENNV
ncbi:MAG: DUF1343 domain-containing protein, partial [Bacteroidales bacterium]|nr:DUF1343 domain-containing protein [Bacteroidales bacterium]MDD3844346.1 DUF1343 domain-containing protein [Bacteroidales bacterium]